MRSWIARDPRIADLLDAVSQRRATTRLDSAWEVNAAWNQVASQLHTVAPAPARDAERNTARGTSISRPWWHLAAAALLVASASMLVLREHRAAPGPVAISETQYVTANGVHRQVTLPDSSVVTLAPATHLRVGGDFGRGARDVWLSGEAIFRVTHDPARPFRVHTGAAVTTVLGTEFSVRAYPAPPSSAMEADIRVVVASGRVSLRPTSRDTGGVVLTPGQMGTLTTNGVATVGEIDVARALGWAQGRLTFDDMPVADVLAELSRWYDADVRVTDSTLARRRVRLDVRGDSLAPFLNALALTLNARWERRGAAVLFSPRGAPR